MIVRWNNKLSQRYTAIWTIKLTIIEKSQHLCSCIEMWRMKRLLSDHRRGYYSLYYFIHRNINNTWNNKVHSSITSKHFTLIASNGIYFSCLVSSQYFQITKTTLIITTHLHSHIQLQPLIFAFWTLSFHHSLPQWGTSFSCFINPFVYISVL